MLLLIRKAIRLKNFEINKKSIELHKKYKGKLSINISNKEYLSSKNFSYIYTPGVAAVCKEIKKYPCKLSEFTNKKNTIAIISNGTAVLGLGNIGAGPAIPVMESKAALLKKYTKINAVPICLIEDSDYIFLQKMIISLSINYFAIMLEDIKAPECFLLLENLKKNLPIPIFHDDQSGTATAILVFLITNLKRKTINLNDKIVISGLGAAGVATADLLNYFGFKNIYGYDIYGPFNYSTYKGPRIIKEKLKFLRDSSAKTLSDLVNDCKIFIGLSVKNLLLKIDLAKFKNNYIILALANPEPEIKYKDVRHDKRCYYYAAGNKSQNGNTINNIFIYPIIIYILFLRKDITEINNEFLMKLASIISNLLFIRKTDLLELKKENFDYIIDKFNE